MSENMARVTTRQLILQTAEVHFMRDGYKGTSTRQIAKEIGITQPNLYHIPFQHGEPRR